MPTGEQRRLIRYKIGSLHSWRAVPFSLGHSRVAVRFLASPFEVLRLPSSEVERGAHCQKRVESIDSQLHDYFPQ
jgi:hypothetical protein